jgi:hypothetical protein
MTIIAHTTLTIKMRTMEIPVMAMIIVLSKPRKNKISIKNTINKNKIDGIIISFFLDLKSNILKIAIDNNTKTMKEINKLTLHVFMEFIRGMNQFIIIIQ